MFITTDELREYTGINPDNNVLLSIFCDASCNVVADYLGYEPETASKVKKTTVPEGKTISLDAMNLQIVSVKVNEDIIEPEHYTVDRQYIMLDKTVPECAEIEINFISGWDIDSMPGIIKLTALRIAGCMSSEADGNIGISSKSFSESGSRVFLNQKYDRYLEPIERYRVYEI